MELVVWWHIPCKGVYPIFEEYNKLFFKVKFIVEEEMSASRKKLGWENNNSSLKYEVIPKENWKNYIDEIINANKDCVHIFNGIGVFSKIYYAIKKVNLERDIKFGIMAEAPHNPFFGFVRLAKTFYTNFFSKFRHRSIKKNADFYFVMSGEHKNQMIKIGWSDHKLFPFGYFTTSNLPSKKTKNIENKITLICTGLITKNKGHILLLKALNQIKSQSEIFELNITGFGPERKNLEQFISKNNLKNVNFFGVLSDYDLQKLMNKSDVLVATGHEEPWGIRINEAINNNLYVLTSDGIGASQFVNYLNCGKVFKSGNVNDLASKLLELIHEKREIIISKDKISPMNAAYFINDVLTNTYKLKMLNSTPPWKMNY